jgi:RHS repeat-associated protein
VLTTTTTYDTIYAAYPLTMTAQPAPSLGPTLTTLYAYYGVNPETPAGGVGLPGQLHKVTDPNGATTRYTYDAFGRPASQRRPNVAFAEYASERDTYRDTVQPFKVEHWLREGPGSNDVLYDYPFYDGLGQVIQTPGEGDASAAAYLVSTRYNALGQVVTQSVPYAAATLGAYQASTWSNLTTTQTTYDGLGRVVRVTQPDGSATNRAYHGRQTAVLDALSHQTIQAVDAFGRLLNSKQYSGTFASPDWSAAAYATASYTYTVRDQLSSVSGADAATTSVTYDLAGRKTQMSDPDMGTWYYGYDALGNLKHQIDAVKPNNLWRAICFYYDGHNRLKGKTYPTGIASPTSYGCPANPGVYTITYSYDSTAGGNAGLGRRTGMTDTSGSTAWVYDVRGRLTQETKTVSGSGAFVTQWGYDAADRVQSQTYPGGEVVNYGYSTRGLPTAVTSTLAIYVADTSYNPLGQVTLRQLGANVVRQAYTYTVASNFRLAELTSGAAPTYANAQNLRYTYDLVGNVRFITDTAAFGGSQTQSFSYDDLNRLKTAQAANGSYGTYTQRPYSYNAAGNVTNFEGMTLAYNDGGHKHGVTHLGGVQQYWYDANGNVITRTNGGLTLTLAYDAENRLIGMGGSVTETHDYDGDGNRVKAVVNGTTSIYIGNYFEVTGGVTKTYYYAGNVRVAERNGGTSYYLLTDHLGGTNVTVTASGVYSTELRYYPYGGARYNPGGQITTFRFTGQRWDPGTGLYWYNSRWYDPLIGRFSQADTIVPQPGNPQSLNRYSYTLNNPLRYTDPTGHCEAEDEVSGCRHAVRPPRDTRYDWMIAHDLNDLLQEPEPVLLTRVTFGEARNRPEARPKLVAAVYLARAASNYNGYGRTLRAQLLKPYQSHALNLTVVVVDNPSYTPWEGEPENHAATMNPTLETDGAEIFADLYAMTLPMYNAMLQGDDSLLPAEVTGPEAWNAFVGDGYRNTFSHDSSGIWPWPGMQRAMTTPRLPRGKQAWMEGY